jgi:hypothetical protein
MAVGPNLNATTARVSNYSSGFKFIVTSTLWLATSVDSKE